MDRIDDIGEFGLIKRIAPLFPTSADVVMGMGDDCAVLRSGPQTLLVTCDLSIEDVHFRRAGRTATDIGWKALAVSLSDIAAMGGVPKFALISLAAPAGTDVDFLEGIAKGIAEAAHFGGVAVVGGDTTQSREGLVIDTIVIGEAPDGRYVLRSGARAGDLVCVTGPTGLSAAGLYALEHGLHAPELIAAHCRPQPRIAEGQWLARQPSVRAMLDVSDGLAQDAGHLAEASGLGIDFEKDRLPQSPLLADFLEGKDGTHFMLSGGEDYELAMAVAPGDWEALSKAFDAEFGRPLFAVGTFTAAHEAIRFDGLPIAKGGFDHFA